MIVNHEITVVSGLPRSGTSLMMQMIDKGGIPALTDQVRVADTDNPRGYYEFERVKRTKHDPSWLPEARGKAVKLVSSLLYDLPASETYRVVFMKRDMDEVLESQEKMLRRSNRQAVPRDQMLASFKIHLEKLYAWLPAQSHMRVLMVSYNTLLASPQLEVRRIAEFLDDQVDCARMLQAIDPSLYRNRMADQSQTGDKLPNSQPD
jgi:hypothetical protein